MRGPRNNYTFVIFVLCKIKVIYTVLSMILSFRLAGHRLSDKSSYIVACDLQSPNCLLQLDLSNNDLRDSGVVCVILNF